MCQPSIDVSDALALSIAGLLRDLINREEDFPIEAFSVILLFAGINNTMVIDCMEQ